MEIKTYDENRFKNAEMKYRNQGTFMSPETGTDKAIGRESWIEEENMVNGMVKEIAN